MRDHNGLPREQYPLPDLVGLGLFVRQQRRRLDLTQRQLADSLGWHQEHLSRLERARYGLPSVPLLARLADGLQVSLAAVLAAAGYPPFLTGREWIEGGRTMGRQDREEFGERPDAEIDAAFQDRLVHDDTVLRTLLDQIPLGITVALAPSGRVIFFNAYAQYLSRLDVRLAASLHDYLRYGAVHADGSPYTIEEYPITRSLQQGETVLNEQMRYRHSDGSESLFTARSAPIRNARGQIVAAVGLFWESSVLAAQP